MERKSEKHERDVNVHLIHFAVLQKLTLKINYTSKKVPHNHRLNNINIFKVFEIKLSNCSTRIIKEREASPERIRDLSLEIG